MKKTIPLLLCAAVAFCLWLPGNAEDALPPRSLFLWQDAAPYTDESPGQPQPRLTAYVTKGAENAIIICPGGGYTGISSREGAPVAERMQKDGFSAYVLTYRVKPCNLMAPLTDAQRAIRTLRSRGYRYVGIMGFSAGGHLAACAAVHWDAGDPSSSDPIDRLSCRPDYFVTCYGVISFASFPQQGSVSNLLGDEADDPELLAYFSPELHVNVGTPPAFIWHSQCDNLVPVGHSLLLAEALSETGVTYELHIYPDGAHGIALGRRHPIARHWPGECVRFIKSVCP